MRIEGSPERIPCETWRVGYAKDNGRAGPTWTNAITGKYCTGPTSGCENHPLNQYALLVYSTGTYQVCANSELLQRRCAAVSGDDRLMMSKAAVIPRTSGPWPLWRRSRSSPPAAAAAPAPTPHPIRPPPPYPRRSPTPTTTALACNPTPPPLYGIQVKVIFDSGWSCGGRSTRVHASSTSTAIAGRPASARPTSLLDAPGGRPPGRGVRFARRGPGRGHRPLGPHVVLRRPALHGDRGPTLGAATTRTTSRREHARRRRVRGLRGPNIPLSQDPDRPGDRCGVCTISGGGHCR